MIAKTHIHHDGRILISVVDTALLGQKFEEGKLQLDLGADFYKGKELGDDEIGDLIRNADMLNLVGEQAVALGIKEEAVDPANVKRIKGIPFASGVNMRD